MSLAAWVLLVASVCLCVAGVAWWAGRWEAATERDAIADEVRRLRGALDTIADDGTAPVWVRRFARIASTTGSGAQAAPPEKP